MESWGNVGKLAARNGRVGLGWSTSCITQFPNLKSHTVYAIYLWGSLDLP